MSVLINNSNASETHEKSSQRNPRAPIELTEAQREFVEQHVRLVHQVAKEFRGAILKEDYQDLVQNLYLRLCKAAVTFDPQRNLAPSTYLISSLKGEARSFFRDAVWPVKPPAEVRNEYAKQKRRAVTEDSEDLRVGNKTLSYSTIESCAYPEQFDSSMEDTFSDQNQPDVAEQALYNLTGGVTFLETVQSALTPLENELLDLRLNGSTFQQIAQHFQLPRMTMMGAWQELQRKLRSYHYWYSEGFDLTASQGNRTLQRAARRKQTKKA